MKYLRVRTIAFCFCIFSPLVLQAQTWVGGASGSPNGFNTAANWTGGVPVSNAGTNITFGITSFPNTSFPGAFTVNGLTFTGTQTYTIGGVGGTLSLGAGGIDANSGSGGANFNSGLPINMTAHQTWTIDANVTLNSNVSGGFNLTKDGSGYLVLSGNNSYSGTTTISGGALYLGSSNTGGGAISIGSAGTLGSAFGDLTLTNAVTLANGATVGGSPFGDSHVDLNGTVTIADPTANFNVAANSDAFFGGTLTAANPTALTVQSTGTGVAILNGTQNNITSITANNAAVAFGKSATLPTTQIHATGGGYVSIADLDAGVSTPSVAAFMALITNKAGFNGVLGFDTDEDANSPHVYSDAINLAGFTDGNVRLGSLTSATLTGTITPVGQSYDFGGFAAQDGLLVVKSNLTELNATTTSVSLVSPSASGGAPQNGMVLILQGAGNNFSGDIDVAYSSLLLDSATPATAGINLGAYSYAGYTEGAGFGTSVTSFGNFAARIASYTGTSILGIDSQDVIDQYVDGGLGTAVHTLTGAVNLSAFSSIYLGTLTGATISNTATITAPSDGTLRFVNLGGQGGFIIEKILNQSNGLVVGMDGSEGAVIFAANNTFSGNTTLLGGQLLVGDTSTTALSGGTLTVTNPTSGDRSVIGTALGSASLANNITVTGTTLRVGTGSDDEGDYLAGTTSLTLSGAISGTGGLEIMGLTTLSGTNSYTGGTTVRANTTVSNNSGLSTGSVFLGYSDPVTTTKSVLTFTTTAPSIGSLADASQFVFQGGTGDIAMGVASTTLTVNQTTGGTYSGQFTGNAFSLVKNGGGQLTLMGANAGQVTSTTIGAGSLAIGNSQATTATFGGDVTINATGGGTGLFFRPGSAQTMTYNGSISGAGNVTINGAGNATTHITGGSSNFTGNTSINSGTLRIGGDNYWSSASATIVNNNSTLQLDGNQTLKNLTGNGTGTVSIASGKVLTVDSVAGSTFNGVISGLGGLTKTGAATTFTLVANNSYTGATVVSAGTLMANGSLASSSVTVDNGAFLMGTGTLNDVTLNSGATYRPGLSNAAALLTLDSLTMTTGAILHMELGGTTYGAQYDALNITNGTGGTGAFNVGNGTLSVTFINSFNPVSGNSFNLFDFTSLTGTFGTLNLQSLTSGLSWDTSALYTTGVLSVTGTAVPEPATTAAFAGLGVLAFAVWRRRQAKARARVQVITRL